MKKTTALLAALCAMLFSPCVYAQHPKKEKAVSVEQVVVRENDILDYHEPTPEPVYQVVEVSAQFPGGQVALMEYLCSMLRYPEEAVKGKIQGRVIVSFVVGKDGSISDVKVVRGRHPSLDEEAVRVVKGMPAWIPGRVNDQSVSSRYVLPVAFNLPE